MKEKPTANKEDIAKIVDVDIAKTLVAMASKEVGKYMQPKLQTKCKYDGNGPNQPQTKKQEVLIDSKEMQEYNNEDEYCKEVLKRPDHFMRVNLERDIEKILMIMEEEPISNFLNQSIAIKRLA